MKIKKSQPSLKKNQSGIASMVIVILIMTLLTLIVLAMTQNSNREQREALDRQLSSQAFYAAESGVSDAKDFIASPPSGVFPPIKKSDCNGVGAASGSGNQFPGKNSQVGDFENTKYTCVLYDRTPTELRFSNIDVKTPTIIPIEDAGGQTITSLTISWKQKDGGNNFSGCPSVGVSLPPALSPNCEAGALRIELVNPEVSNRSQLLDETFLAYIKPAGPAAAASPISYGSASGSVANQGAITSGRCDTATGRCSVRISSINRDKLYLNLRSIYKANEVNITGERAGGEIRFRDAQMEVDSTGQSGEILRRVQVMIDLSGLNSSFVPSFVLQTSSDVCKRLEVRPAEVTDGC